MQAVKELGLNVPLVVRLQGTNAEKAKKLQNIIDAGQNEKISDNKKRLDRMEEK